MDTAKWGTNCWYTLVEETTFHNAGSSAGFNIALKREGEKIKTKMENKLYISYLITHPSIDIAELGLILLSRRVVVLSLWDSILFPQRKYRFLSDHLSK